MRAVVSHGRLLIFGNLVVKLAAYSGLMLVVIANAGCSLHRVAIRTSIRGIPIEVSCYGNDKETTSSVAREGRQEIGECTGEPQ